MRHKLGFFDRLRLFIFALRLWKAAGNQSEWVINGSERGEGGSGGEPLSCGSRSIVEGSLGGWWWTEEYSLK